MHEPMPFRLDTTTNAEFAPQPLGPLARLANALGTARADDNARRLGLSRRAFLRTASGVATALLAHNDAFASTNPGGFFQLSATAAVDADEAMAALNGKEFIFDVQTHYMNPAGAWRNQLFGDWNLGLRIFPRATCGKGFLDRVFGSIDCFSAQHFIKDIFLDSDTDMAVLTFVPSMPEDTPLTLEEGDHTRQIVDALEGSHRLLLHGRVHPNIPGELERMPQMAERYKLSAWKSYTGFGPGGVGWHLDDPKIGIPFIESARKLGVKLICTHKGLPLPMQAHEYSLCRDVGVVAKAYPDMTFIIYHSGYEPGVTEGPFTPGATRGIDGFIDSLKQNGVAPNSNVFCDLGSTWRHLMRKPTDAAHAIGKLLTHVGEDRVLWGTDSIWYGTPQPMIQAFRTFQISPELREKHGYPEITSRLRAKMLGLNAALPYGVALDEVKQRASRDVVGRMREAYAEAPSPSFRTLGPQTRSEFLRHWLQAGSRP